MPGTAGLAAVISAYGTWVLVGICALMAALETVAPRRELRLSTPRRWTLHTLLYLLPAVTFPLIFGAGLVAVAIGRAAGPYPVLGRPEIPFPLQLALWLLAADLLRYGQHRLFHSVWWLWRIHLLHHSDRDFDFTNEFRFHPLEAVLNRFSSLAAILLLAPPPLAVALEEMLALITGVFDHGNFRLPASVERRLRLVFITPELHQVHHSIEAPDQQCNLGTVFVWWDRIFGTYQASPARGFDTIEFGVEEVGPRECARPVHLLAAPFRSYEKPSA